MGQLLLFGGSVSGGELNDTWSFGIPSDAVLFWNNMNPASSPPVRYSASVAFDPCSGTMILFGGIHSHDGTLLNDTWAYDVVGNTWTELFPPNSPSARNSSVWNLILAVVKLFCFPVVNSEGYPGDTWTYDTASNLLDRGHSFRFSFGRNAASMAFDPCSGRMILFGGYVSGDVNDTWAYDSTANTWTQLTTIGSPPARDSASMAFDPTSGQIILFGGYSNNTGGNLLNDTWGCTYNQTSDTYTWTQLFPDNPPSARYGYAFKFNPVSGQILLFGGGYLSSTSNDTWAYEGATNTWTQLNPVNPPQAREFAGFDFNPVSGQMILFGGVSLPSQTVFGDTVALGMGRFFTNYFN